MKEIMDLFLNNIESILAFIGGGGALALITLPTSKRKAQAETDMAMQAVYSQVLKDANEQLVVMREDYNSRINELRKELNELRKELDRQRPFRCIDMNCTRRIIQ